MTDAELIELARNLVKAHDTTVQSHMHQLGNHTHLLCSRLEHALSLIALQTVAIAEAKKRIDSLSHRLVLGGAAKQELLQRWLNLARTPSSDDVHLLERDTAWELGELGVEPRQEYESEVA